MNITFKAETLLINISVPLNTYIVEADCRQIDFGDIEIWKSEV